MQKSLTPVLGFLDEGILAPTTESVMFTSLVDGQPVTAPRSMSTFDLSDFIDEVYGTANADAIFAEAGDDKVNGGAGDDHIDGGAGMDTLYGGDGNDDLFGGYGADYLQGDAGNDVLSGGIGNDTMAGGTGDDVYMVWEAGDVVIENAGQGNDTVMARLSGYTLGANVENLMADPAMANVPVTFTGNALNNRISGSAGGDFLYGGAGNDQLDGKAGVDMMYGGAGNDSYRVDSTGDRTLEAAGEGTDSVIASMNWTLDQNVENLFFENTAALPNKGFTGYGNELANKIVGADGSDELHGFGGDDILDGGNGWDFLFGGAGNDTYVLDGDWDWITEKAGEGIDTVRTNLADIVLQENVENLSFFVTFSNGQLQGPANFIGRGNAGNNQITGWELNDTLYGNDGNDTLEGLGGADTLDGGNGNDWLDGGTGANTLIGGAGDDGYVLTNDDLETVVEAAGGGEDTVWSKDATTTLAANVEDLRFIGTGNFVGHGNASFNDIYGGANVKNTLFGEAGNDKLMGGNLDDCLDGGTGADTMVGGMGNDGYVVDSMWDTVVEGSGQGFDTVNSLLDNFTLPANFEVLRFASAADCIGVGNDGNNFLLGDTGDDQLFGKAGDDVLYGEEGNDRLDGGTGSNSLYGGSGKDMFIFRQAVAGEVQTVRDFVKGEDKIDFSGIDGNAAQAGDQQLAFSFNGQFVGGGQGSFYVEKVAYAGSGSYQTFVHVDCNGDGQLDLDVLLTGASHYALSIGDFGL